ncbi:MAG TPA: molybdopterin cofactor-binding domain-containing protein, partial [Thermoanaerobaculia bacterium]|nr:molybdopterin cofactor-binding domain-containing protein [Thermoanaerobaculia bacterium]
MDDRGIPLRARERPEGGGVLSATRRDFLRLSAVTAGGFVLGVRFLEAAREAGAEFRPNAWVRIDSSGKVFLTVGKSEMGQGVRTSLPMILAEQLEVEVESVELVQAQPGPDFQDLGTFGSRSLRTLWLPLSTAGAAAREMLVAAAAATWGVEPASCKAENGRVIHPPSRRSLGYGELASAAGRLPVPASPAVKPLSQFRLVGKDRRRVDAPRIVAGEALFASDVRRPGMKVASIVRCPVYGGKPRSWNAEKAKAVPGVRLVAQISSGLAVVADDTWSAFRGREALEATIAWDEENNAGVSSADVLARLTQAASRAGGELRRGGHVEAALGASARTLEAEYFYPFQAHAPIEPMCAVADVRAGRCEIWAGTQHPNRAQEEAAKALGLPASAVTVHVTLLGGGFGRRGQPDFVLDAVEASRAAGAPVQTVWTRQDDMRHDAYHSASLHRLRAGLDASGFPTAWRHKVVVVSNRSSGDPLTPEDLRGVLRGAYDVPYAIPAVSVDAVEAPSPLRLGAWRGVQHNHNVFAVERFIDELARAAGKDPLEYRLTLLKNDAAVAGGRDGAPVDRARLAAVLALAGEKARWSVSLPAGRGKGVACASYDGRTPAAVVAEVTAERGSWRADRIVCAVDCGIPVNPLGIRAQVEGSVAWALSALAAEITLKNGRVEQAQYRDFPILRFRDMPKVETH